MNAARIQRQRGRVTIVEGMLTNARSVLAQRMMEAQEGGATIAQLMEWTGYSRRQVFNMLEAARNV